MSVCGGKVIVNKVTNDLYLVTTGCKPNLNLVCFIIVLVERAHTVVVTEEALYESRELMCNCHKEICGCLRKLFLVALNYKVVNLKRLVLCIGDPCTKRTDIALELFKVLCNLVFVDHTVAEPCDLLKGCNA